MIGDAQYDDLLGFEGTREALTESGAVDPLHDEDEIGPFDLLFRESDFGVFGEAG